MDLFFLIEAIYILSYQSRMVNLRALFKARLFQAVLSCFTLKLTEPKPNLMIEILLNFTYTIN